MSEDQVNSLIDLMKSMADGEKFSPTSTVDKTLLSMFMTWVQEYIHVVVKANMRDGGVDDEILQAVKTRNEANSACESYFASLVESGKMTNADAVLNTFISELKEAHNKFVDNVAMAMLSDRTNRKPKIVKKKDGTTDIHINLMEIGFGDALRKTGARRTKK